jgi:hypothetical protein
MTRTKLGLLSLCAMASGLMAFGVTGAQATASAKWLILDAAGQLKEGSTLHAMVNVEADSPVLILHSEILKIEVLFLCTEVKAVEAKLLAEGSIGKEAGVVKGSKLLFNKCTTDLNLQPASECTPIDPVDGKGTIVSKPGHSLLVLGASGEDLLELIPDTGLGTTLAVIGLPPTCPIGTSVPVIGRFNLKQCENLALTHLVKHLVEEGPGTRLFTISETAEHAATFLGSMWGFLVGDHTGLKFSGDPN